MKQEISPMEFKLRSIMQHAPMGLIEIDESGNIIEINLMGYKLLTPVGNETLAAGSSIYPYLTALNPGLVDRIRSFSESSGLIIFNEHYSFRYPSGAQSDFKLTVSKMFEDCLMISVEDITEKVQEEQALKQAQLDEAVAQGKYEIASEVIHDVGNAVVGFGSYLTRINRMLEQYNQQNLEKVAGFLKQQQEPISKAIGAPKAAALVDMMDAINRSLSDSQQELRQSVNEQLRLITHIQDILNIQRQYVNGHQLKERKAVNLKDIISDCRSMIFAGMEKKGISLSLSLPSARVEIKGDRTKLMQVLLNILKNSVEAIDTAAAEKTIGIDLNETEHTIKLTITDTGKGFDQHTAKHLFDRGYTTKNTGTGLGLYNCKAIVESHAGTITIESAGPDTGSKTTIEFKK